jgi:hypothetical protein
MAGFFLHLCDPLCTPCPAQRDGEAFASVFPFTIPLRGTRRTQRFTEVLRLPKMHPFRPSYICILKQGYGGSAGKQGGGKRSDQF